MIKKIIRKIAFKTGRLGRLYAKVCNPSGHEYADYLQKWGNLRSIGDNCSIRVYTNITDPEYTRLGNNVQLADCSLFCHDGSIAFLNRAYGKKLDRVGKIDIKDNVYVGHGATILPGVTIGPNALIAAGAVVLENSRLESGHIYAGVPAKKVKKLSPEAFKNNVERIANNYVMYASWY